MLWLFYSLELVALFLYNILKIVSNSYLEWVLTLVNALTFYSHLFTAETVQNPIEVEKNIDFFLIHCSENFHPISVAFQADHIQWNDEISIKMCVVLRWKFNRIAIDRQLLAAVDVESTYFPRTRWVPWNWIVCSSFIGNWKTWRKIVMTIMFWGWKEMACTSHESWNSITAFWIWWKICWIGPSPHDEWHFDLTASVQHFVWKKLENIRSMKYKFQQADSFLFLEVMGSFLHNIQCTSSPTNEFVLFVYEIIVHFFNRPQKRNIR